MTSVTSNYFRYYAVPLNGAAWGVAVSAAGFTRIVPHSPYPPVRHPADHHFDWEHGRILEALVVVLITAGRGHFESRETGRRVIEAGTAFMLFPGVWHRYRPEPAVGWNESWVELRGTTVTRLLKAKLFSPRAPILHNALSSGLELTLDAIHAKARSRYPGFDSELATRGLAVLAAWEQARLPSHRQSLIAQAIVNAEHYLAEHLPEPIDIDTLAPMFKVGDSHFRKAFKKHTGFSPWQYMLHLRLAHARRYLLASDASLDEIAARVGFSSAFHFSAAFKQGFGLAPAHWRRQMRDSNARKAEKVWSRVPETPP